MKRLLALIILSLFIIGCGATGNTIPIRAGSPRVQRRRIQDCTQEDMEKAKKKLVGEPVPCPVKK